MINNKLHYIALNVVINLIIKINIVVCVEQKDNDYKKKNTIF